MARRKKIYEGKAKILYQGPEPGTIVQYFKDDATAFNNEKKGTITGKGVLNNRISEFIMLRLAEVGVPTHFVRRLNMREQLVREVEIIPVEVVVRNIAAGSQPIAAEAMAQCWSLGENLEDAEPWLGKLFLLQGLFLGLVLGVGNLALPLMTGCAQPAPLDRARGGRCGAGRAHPRRGAPAGLHEEIAPYRACT